MQRLYIILFILGFSTCWSQSKSILDKYPKSVQVLIGIEKGVFRGASFGDSRTKIKSSEVGVLQAESDTALNYDLMVDNNNYADLIYNTDTAWKIKAFFIVFIREKNEEDDRFKTSLIKYYNERFGYYTVKSPEIKLWTSKDGYLVEMRDRTDETGTETEVIYYIL